MDCALIHLYWGSRLENREQLARRLLATLQVLGAHPEYDSWTCYSTRPVIKVSSNGKKRRKKEIVEEQVIHDVDWLAERLDAHKHQDGEFNEGLGYHVSFTAASGLDISISAGGGGAALNYYQNRVVLYLRVSDVEELKGGEFKTLLMSLVPIWEPDRGLVLTREIIRKRVGIEETNRTMPGIWLYERETGEVSFHPELITGD